jgi:hypothetical protein
MQEMLFLIGKVASGRDTALGELFWSQDCVVRGIEELGELSEISVRHGLADRAQFCRSNLRRIWTEGN